ncbi:hypothetical protein Sjap_018027 [Stephania japonica]|uniref:Uncharacterized protein n=1 Tax=Stephania japonica TaxID=461633 RepID=A0AAP0I783_9MAGN
MTTKRLRELKLVLQGFQREKKISDNIKSIHEFSDVLSVDLSKRVDEVLIHPSLCSSFANSQLNNISDFSSSRLEEAVDSLKQEKERRLRKLQDLGSTVIELWNTFETPADERERFDPITTFISVTVDDVTTQGSLTLHIIKQDKVEIEKLKASKMKKLVLEKPKELEEINKSTHIYILKAKELALSRKGILEKVEKLKHASVEESWLHEYEKDQNRNCARRYACKNLKRAKKARKLVGKLPFHSVEYEFGGHDSPSTGIFKGKPRECFGLTFRKSIRIGRMDLGPHEERFYFGDHIMPCFETGIPLLKQRLHQLPDAENISIAFPDDGAWKRFYKQLQHFPMV